MKQPMTSEPVECLGMTRPTTRGVRTTTGRLLALQGRAALGQIVRRTTESWGARSTVSARATHTVAPLPRATHH